MRKDDFGDRMKGYENITRHYLLNRTPIIIRLDGTHFHTFTKHFKKPFDDVLVNSMQETMLFLCQNIPGVMLGYTQSDEISLFIQNYEHLETSTWFDGNIQKMASVSASMATMEFNRRFAENYKNKNIEDYKEVCVYTKAISDGAFFDSRVFNIPKEEVCNYFLWREQDAMRNSINMVGFANFSSKKMHGKNTLDVKKMLLDIGVDYDEFPVYLQRGTCCRKVLPADKGARAKWEIDESIPVFKGEGRNYIEKLVYFSEN